MNDEQFINRNKISENNKKTQEEILYQEKISDDMRSSLMEDIEYFEIKYIETNNIKGILTEENGQIFTNLDESKNRN